jgi:SAM-dependent methyltransferase
MDNKKAWEREYKNPNFVTKNPKPQESIMKFLRWVKKNKQLELEGLSLLDLGCGTGRNSFYMANKYDAQVTAFDFAAPAIDFAKKHFAHENVDFSVRDMSEDFPLEDGSVDLVFDVMASFALKEDGRENYLKEMHRVLKPGGLVYIRTLAKEGDKNAAFLIKENTGGEYDTYIHPTLGSQERVFSGPDFKELYGRYFDVVRMERKSGYQKFDGQPYKRNYWSAYLKKI